MPATANSEVFHSDSIREPALKIEAVQLLGSARRDSELRRAARAYLTRWPA